jgi:hypothetical protein
MTALRCSGCGAEGHPPVVVHDERQLPPGTVFTPVFGWHADGRPALLCGKCRGRLGKNRGRARYNKPRPTDGRLTP